MAQFVLDSDVLIQAHRAYYPFHVFPSFWNRLLQLAQDDEICSIQPVKGEIIDQEDELAEWCNNQLPEHFFHPLEQETVDTYTQTIVSWVEGKRDHYKERAIAEFYEAERADAWLVAYCKTYDLTLVTQEVAGTGSRKQIKIPDACMDNGVEQCNTISMLGQLGVQF